MNRIPKKVHLGENRTVLICKVDPATIAGIVGKDKAGCWDGENSTIWIDKSLSSVRQWRVYRHELKHALIDVHEEENGSI